MRRWDRLVDYRLHLLRSPSFLQTFCLPSVTRLVGRLCVVLVVWMQGSAIAEPASPILPPPIRFVLTFDDGPSGAVDNNPTAQILDVLAMNAVQPDIKAVFFLQTRAARAGGSDIGKQLAQREYRDGHVLAFHTATSGHANHVQLRDEELSQSLANGAADLRAVTATMPTLVRPPFWNYNARTVAAYERHGMHMLLTDLSANDGKIWGFNFSPRRRSNLLRQMGDLENRWRAGEMPVVDNVTPVIVTFHDLNTYTARHIEEYLQILLECADAQHIPVTTRPFYDDRLAIERAASMRTVRDGNIKVRLPGAWNWIWQSGR